MRQLSTIGAGRWARGLGVLALSAAALGCDAAGSDDLAATGETVTKVEALSRVSPAPRIMRVRPRDQASRGDVEEVTAAASASPGGVAAPNQTVRVGNGVEYRGGHVMTGTINLYYIWYGDWVNNTAIPILEDFAKNIGGSPYWAINGLYDDRFGGRVSNQVKFRASTYDPYTHGATLTNGDISDVVELAISQGRLPRDTNGVYFVLTSADVNQSDIFGTFCQQFCGWHNYAPTTNLKYSFVGNTDRCPQSCGLPVAGPNYNQGADTMASIIAHELEETATDPQLDAWSGAGNHAENADQCEGTFGSLYATDTGASRANVKLGPRNYLIQQNWVNADGGFCAMSYRGQPIAIGMNHTLAVQTDGSLWSWGRNDKGQLGDGNRVDRLTPRMLSPGWGPSGPRWSSVAAGNGFSFALRSDGTLWAWGDRSLGQLGDGVVSATPLLTAKQIGGAEWAAVRAGDQHVVAIKKDSSVWSWGYGGFGQLGIGDTTNRAVPTREANSQLNWNVFAAGAVHTLAARGDGYLQSWGWNDWGTLGVGDASGRSSPTFAYEPTAVAGWTMFDGGFDFSLGLAHDGSLWTWGRNLYGQLGASSGTSYSLIPTKWISGTSWAGASAGYLHGIGVKQDGSLWTWGSNNAGQLGTGAAVGTTNGPVAQESTKAKNWVSVLGRQEVSMGIKHDGAVWGWGNNASGQLGTGNTSSTNTPIALSWTLSRPLVQIAGPATPPALKAPASIPLTATATGGRITKVEFYSGSTRLGEDTTSPYAFTWANVSPGAYAITAKATNALGETTTSAPVSVAVASMSVATATPPASVSFTTDGAIDWLHLGLKTAASVEKKNVSTHAIRSFFFQHGGSSNDFVRDTGTALAINWTDGTPDLKPNADGSPTSTGVKSRAPDGFNEMYELSVLGTPSANRVASVYLKLVNADVTFTFELDGQTYTNTWSNPGTTPVYRVYKVTYRSSTTTSEGTIRAQLTGVRTGGNVSFLGATVR